MILRVIEARLAHDFVVWLRFNDGTQGEVDLADELDGPIFKPLRSPKMFAEFRLDPELHTLVWPNGADIAPEFLHEHTHVPCGSKRAQRNSGERPVVDHPLSDCAGARCHRAQTGSLTSAIREGWEEAARVAAGEAAGHSFNVPDPTCFDEQEWKW